MHYHILTAGAKGFLLNADPTARTAFGDPMIVAKPAYVATLPAEYDIE
jgi:hypothetical protein